MNMLLGLGLLLAAVLAALLGFTWRAARRVEAALPPQGRFVDLPGARLHVLDKGQGPAIVLIHGLSGQLCHFSYGVVDRLAPQHRVVAVDRPGAGYSVRQPGAAATLAAQADVLAALIDALGLERPLVVGHSLGGAVALTLAQRHPQKVAGLALLAPLTYEPMQMSPVFAGLVIHSPWLRRLVAWTLAVPAMMRQRDRILSVVFGPEAVPADFGMRGGALLGVRPSHFVGARADLVALAVGLPALAQGYAAMRLPVAVLFGRGDRILDPAEQGGALAKAVPGVRLELVDGGHMLPITQPQRSADFIAEMARQVHLGRV